LREQRGWLNSAALAAGEPRRPRRPQHV